MKRGTTRRPSIRKMALRAFWDGGPGLCHFAITSACNARCDFCSFARPAALDVAAFRDPR